MQLFYELAMLTGTNTAASIPISSIMCNLYGHPLTASAPLTGPIPDGADAVVQVEDTEVVEDGASNDVKKIRILKTVTKGHDIRPVVIFFTDD